MQRKLDVYLWDIQQAGQDIVKYTTGKSLEDYIKDGLVRAAVERCFTIMGEGMVRIRQHFPSDYDLLPEAPQVIAFRNHLIHRYEVIENEQVWQIIQVFLPSLLKQIHLLLENQQP